MNVIRHPNDDEASAHVAFRGAGVLCVAGRLIESVHVDLVGGRGRYSVGGRVAEGPRWWRGRLQWPGEDEQPAACSEVVIQLDNGRSGVAVIESDPTASPHSVAIHGLSPPPFEVP